MNPSYVLCKSFLAEPVALGVGEELVLQLATCKVDCNQSINQCSVDIKIPSSGGHPLQVELRGSR